MLKRCPDWLDHLLTGQYDVILPGMYAMSNGLFTATALLHSEAATVLGWSQLSLQLCLSPMLATRVHYNTNTILTFYISQAVVVARELMRSRCVSCPPAHCCPVNGHSTDTLLEQHLLSANDAAANTTQAQAC